MKKETGFWSVGMVIVACLAAFFTVLSAYGLLDLATVFTLNTPRWSTHIRSNSSSGLAMVNSGSEQVRQARCGWFDCGDPVREYDLDLNSFWRNLTRVHTYPEGDPCKATHLLSGETWGFGSHISMIVDDHVWCFLMGCTLAFYNKPSFMSFHGKFTNFSVCHFPDDVARQTCEGTGHCMTSLCDDGKLFPWLWQEYEVHMRLFQGLMSKLPQVILAGTVAQYLPQIEQEFQSVHQVGNEAITISSLNGNYYALHVRRGDKKEGMVRHSCAQFYRMLRSHSNIEVGEVDPTPLFVASDDPNAGEEMVQAIKDFYSPRVIGLPLVFHAPRVMRSDDDGSYVTLMRDLKVLVEAKMFVGNQLSNMGMLVYSLRSGVRCFDMGANLADIGSGFWDPTKNKLSRV